MSQGSRRRGQRVGSSSEASGAPTRTTAEPDSPSSRPRERAGPTSRGERQGSGRSERRPARESGVHAILNPLQDEPAGPASSSRPRRTSALYSDDPAQRRQSTSYTATSRRSSRGQGLPTEPVINRPEAGERPTSTGLVPLEPPFSLQQPRYGQTSTFSAPFQPGQPYPSSEGGLPHSAYGRIGDPNTSAGERERRRGSLSEYSQAGSSALRASGLAADVGQLDLGGMGSAPAGAGGQGTFEYMTLNTEHGPISVPIDNQAASRLADEKRRRNAGASARFRARRKERESLSTQEIDELRQQMDELQDEVNFYRRERDYLVPLVYNSPDRDRHFPRPLSPRRRRLVHRPGTPSLGQLYEEHGQRAAQGRLTRRRLSVVDDLQLGPGVVPQLPSVQQGAPGFGTPPAHGYPPPLPRGQPPQYLHPPSQLRPPSQPPGAVYAAPNPAQQSRPYERSWPPPGQPRPPSR